MKRLNKVIGMLLIAIMFSVHSISGVQGIAVMNAQAATVAPKLSETKKTLYVGYKNYAIKFTGLSSKAKVSYKSSDTKIARVTSKGVVQPLKKGKANISVTIKQNNKTYTRLLAITVKNPSVAITNSIETIELDKTYTLKAKTYGISKINVQWTSSNTKIAKVGKTSGKITPVKEGTVKITATEINSGKKVTVTIKVNPKAVKPTVTPKPTAIPSPTPKPTETPAPTPKPVEKDGYIYTTIISADFEDHTSGFTSRGGENVHISNELAKSGSYSLRATGRTATWQGPAYDVSSFFAKGKTYQISAWVTYKGTERNLEIQATMDKNTGGEYQRLATADTTAGTWKKIDITYVVPQDAVNLKFYFEASGSASADLYVDDFTITEVSMSEEGITSVPSLYSAYKNYFSIGTALSEVRMYQEPTKKLVKHQFNTITYENEMKPSSLLDYTKNSSNLALYKTNPAINTERLDKYMKYAQDNGLKVRFHTLVWHSQTPRWFFTENYSNSANAPLASKEVMLKRMENYIKNIMECTSKYPDVIYAWDVVNEAIEPGHGQSKGYRTSDSLWYQIVGEEFVEKAFEYARKYSYDDSKLFYNDYNTYISNKTTAIYNMALNLKNKGLIDGIGMQSHLDMNFPSLQSYETAVLKFAQLGLEIQVTELDMHNNQNTTEALRQQAQRYGDIFALLVRLKDEGKANITNVTFWGIYDSDSWLTYHRKEKSYPLMFDGSGNPKPAFYKVIEAAAKK